MRIDVITVGRSDYGIYRPVLKKIQRDTDWSLGLIVSGGHLDAQSGVSLKEIERDNIEIRAKIPLECKDDSQASIALMMAQAITGLADHYTDASKLPDLCLVLGDRYEMFAFASATVPFNIPLAHLHGGELSYGAMDEVFRHAITKLSHIHFASTQSYADRIVRLGEQPDRVFVSGAPALDQILSASLPSFADVQQKFQLDFDLSDAGGPLLLTYHPTTRSSANASDEIDSLLSALMDRPEPIIITAPNLDQGQRAIRTAYAQFIQDRPTPSFFVESFGHLNYLSVLRHCKAVIGNSSSGIIETASFKVPTLNIGNRQEGRLKPFNVKTVSCQAEQIRAGLTEILSSDFQAGWEMKQSPYGTGNAADIIVKSLGQIPLTLDLVKKRFHDYGT